MERSEIDLLLNSKAFPVRCEKPTLVETHISWVILCNERVFKIKKPIKYSFLDFSILEKREHYCKEEVLLNRRLVEGIYLGVVPIIKERNQIKVVLKEGAGQVIDYAVMMKRMPYDRRMDLMLQRSEVELEHIEQIAQQLVDFHEHTSIAYDADYLSVHHNFNDILLERDFLAQQLKDSSGKFIDNMVKQSDEFLHKHKRLLAERSQLGFFKDCHGDLHSRNIFLLDEPVIFDCIEFNDSIRKIDLLNELAFFCMDMEANGHSELSQYFLVCYTKLSSTIHTKEERELFIYYKAYRANVRAKVNALRAQDSTNAQPEIALAECKKYLDLAGGYMQQIA